MKRRALAAVVFLAVPSLGASSQSRTIVIEADRVMTMSGEGTVGPALIEVRDGKIVAVRGGRPSVPPGGTRLQATVVLPGLIDARTTLGLSGLIAADDEQDETSGPNQAHVRALDAFNLEEPMLRHALRSGVTAVQSGPGGANAIGGEAGVFKTYSSTAEPVVLKFPSALVLALTEDAKTTYGSENGLPSTRMATVGIVRQALVDAEHYSKRLDEGEPPDRSLKHEAVARVLSREVPALVSAKRIDEIATAIRVAEEFDLDLTIVGATDAGLVADRLGAAGVTVLVGPPGDAIFGNMPSHTLLRLPAVLKAGGVRFALVSGDDEEAPRLALSQLAALAAANGLDAEDALAAITIDAARILGVADRVGSIEVGKDADLVMYDGDPFSYGTHVTAVLVDGHIAYQRNAPE